MPLNKETKFDGCGDFEIELNLIPFYIYFYILEAILLWWVRYFGVCSVSTQSVIFVIYWK